MKLATLSTSCRDGQLVVVSQDLEHCVAVPDIAATVQQALDDWNHAEPALRDVYRRLSDGALPDTRRFDPQACHSPLPRAYQFLDGSAYLNHVELVRKARGAKVPESFYNDPLMYQGGSDSFIPPYAAMRADESWGIDFEGEIAVITGDVPLGAAPADCTGAIRLVTLMNDVSLRELLRTEIAKELGFVQSKPASSFAPVAVTPDELGGAWRDSKLYLPVCVHLNGKLFGKPNAGLDMNFDFSQLVSHAALTRDLEAGSIVGSGTVSNKQDLRWGSSIDQGGVGYCCIAELRMYEIIEQGRPITPFMRHGDTVSLEVLDENGKTVFGRIENHVHAIGRDADRLATDFPSNTRSSIDQS
ncbi:MULTISPECIES: fumarylacetoacetate hydrolase family protein [unclassified Pigmentiphaga]|uniref:fumarylacetoacetate hydrolase family protein n=1 Tax=unclassified Pigmentiphaga TaxID=2626614 RepID=UPI000B421E30|nr:MULTISPECIES: fumarylacetoacetate hydrolase family protein [unclassified Pigmentiphaga]OVZ66434.1 2-keto-4-pentenoate hydratase [Pigmentiphaga sp. NML030171]